MSPEHCPYNTITAYDFDIHMLSLLPQLRLSSWCSAGYQCIRIIIQEGDRNRVEACGAGPVAEIS